MQVLGIEAVARGAVVFARGEGGEEAVEVLHVGDVAADADDGGVVEGAEPLDVGEAGQGAVGCCGGLRALVCRLGLEVGGFRGGGWSLTDLGCRRRSLRPL